MLIKDTKDIISLIKQAIKINNKNFQRERVNKGNNKTISVYRAPQQIQKLWYGAKPIDFSGI